MMLTIGTKAGLDGQRGKTNECKKQIPVKELETVSRHSPEQKGQRCCEYSDEDRYPDCTSKQQLLDVGLAHGKCAERRGFRLVEEDEDGIKFVLMRNEKEDGESEGDE